MNGKNSARLKLWQERRSRAKTAYEGELAKMDGREALYQGMAELRPLTASDRRKNGGVRKATHVRNIVAENIESMVNSTIPQPKVTARFPEDEPLARRIEHMIKNELDRLPMEQLNDMMERTVPIQGGGVWLIEWDNTLRSHTTVGEVTVSAIHPKQIIPQDGVFTGMEDMDYWFLDIPQTKGYIKRRYGIDLSDESESEPQTKGAKDAATAEDLVTQHYAYYRNDRGGIGLYTWVNDIELEAMDDYQARRLRRCVQCGEPQPEGGGKVCPKCNGTKFTSQAEEYEEVWEERETEDGTVIPGASEGLNDTGLPAVMPTRVPYYKPNVYPGVLQKNISVFGKFLGDSDVDKIADQQNTVNRMEMKIIDRIVKAGTRITLPDNPSLRVDPEDNEVWRVGNAADISQIKSLDFTGNLQFELAFCAQTYEEARQILGITDSFQGRQDSTASSGVAKQFSAAQAAGRLESKRVMKDAAWSDMFRLIFQFVLAYADEPRRVSYRDDKGQTQFETFSRYDFLRRDDAGEYWWDDQFLFSCDASAPLANNREKMWETTTGLFTSGAFGNPSEIDTLILYWTKMESLSFPGAGDTRKLLEERKQTQMQQMMQMQAMAQAAQTVPVQDVGAGAANPAAMPLETTR